MYVIEFMIMRYNDYNFGDFMVIIENYEDLLGFHGIYGKVLI